ncbi:MAG TPA: Gmad2 immunoglobulin-like domain-containing protein [Acidimicrobiia bacterium]
MRRVVVLTLLVLIAGCTGAGTGSTVTSSSTTSTTRGTSTTSLPPVVECPGVGEFEEGGNIADIPAETSDSRNIGQISWERNDRCETFHFEFVTSEGAPATTAPGLSVDHLESFQVIRVRLDIETAVLEEQLVETGLVDRLYVVRSLSGDLFVDLHLSEPVAARATVSSSPARLSLELRPGIVPFTGASTIGEDLVLTSPAQNEVADDIQLLGYARTATGEVTAVATQDDSVVTEATATTADAAGSWGEFRIGLSLPPGQFAIFIGEESPDEGLHGITLDLTVN